MAESSSKQEEVAISIRDGDIKEAGPPRLRSGLQRVPVALRGNEKQKHIYEPVAVPLGPYHHGRLPEFYLVEQIKEEAIDMVRRRGDRDRAQLLRLVSMHLPKIREFYGGADGYGDEELAAMMLHDTCFVLCFIVGNYEMIKTIIRRVGFCGALFMRRDLFMLENQIPLWLISLLAPFAYGDSHGLKERLPWFLVRWITCSMEETETTTTLPWVNDGELPLHLLEASQRLLLPSSDQDLSTDLMTDHETPALLFNNMFRSATDLKVKGIHLRPSSQSLTDISFFSYSTHGQLHLPVFRISDTSRVLLSNLVAYELLSDESAEQGVICYVGLMKTLLRGEEDVELLREKEILYSSLSNGEVVRLFQDIDTCGLSNPPSLNDVKKRIEKHCNNKGKTWLAELINTYFRSPLTALGLFAAAFILALTFLQTFYTINPRYANAAPTTP